MTTDRVYDSLCEHSNLSTAEAAEKKKWWAARKWARWNLLLSRSSHTCEKQTTRNECDDGFATPNRFMVILVISISLDCDSKRDALTSHAQRSRCTSFRVWRNVCWFRTAMCDRFHRSPKRTRHIPQSYFVHFFGRSLPISSVLRTPAGQWW